MAGSVMLSPGDLVLSNTVLLKALTRGLWDPAQASSLPGHSVGLFCNHVGPPKGTHAQTSYSGQTHYPGPCRAQSGGRW